MTLRFLSLLAAAPVALATTLTSRDAGTKAINWNNDCNFQQEVSSVECASLDVPLDYTDPDGGTLSLSLAKVPAAKGPSKGSILMNFGGPGGEAIRTLGKRGPLLLNMTGGHHDLIAFDPRGTGQTMPLSCFENQDDREAYHAGTTLLYDESDDAPGELWQRAGAIAKACKETMEGGELVGTAFVARDLMQVVDALDEDGLLRYWGISYGSVLGATVANMFPDRMDKVVLDGVVNSDNYYHGFHLDADQLRGADAAWLAFLDECISAGDDLCAISSLNSTAAELAGTLSRAADRFRADPVDFDGKSLTYSLVKTLYYLILKKPENLLAMTTLLRAVITGVGLEDVAEYTSHFGATFGTESLLGIGCSDAIPRADGIEGVQGEVGHMLDVSERFGGMFPRSSMVCAQWPFEAKERRPLDGVVETKSPVLLIGNTWDPTTGVHTAYTMSEMFSGSVVVEQKGFGHGSFAQRSDCTWKVMADYFDEGKLPEGNIKCDVESELSVEAEGIGSEAES